MLNNALLPYTYSGIWNTALIKLECFSVEASHYMSIKFLMFFLFLFFLLLNRRFSYHSIHMHVMYIFKNPDHEPSEFT